MTSNKWAEEVFEQLTLEEKISLLSGKSMWTLRDIDRLGVPSIRVSDGPQGLRKAVTDITAMESFPATCFPTACALACSWNRDLLTEVGQALAKECRHQQVNILLGPGLNLKRHPRGGRNFEYFSEDPLVSGHLAASMVKGIQGSGHVGACIKHVCVNNQESWRFRVNAIVDERTLRELYLKGFEMVVKMAQPWTMMCAYNQLNGKYCSENEWLFEQVVRKEWGYEGHVLTDWGATNQRAAGIEAGIDLEMPGSNGIHDSLIKSALKDGKLSRDKFDAAVLRNLRLIDRAATGMRTGDTTGPHAIPSRPELLYESHHEVAYNAALECVVLLQNTDGILPLSFKQQSSKPTKVALIGDFCRDPRYQGMGSSKVHSTKVDTILEHINKYTDQFVFSRGYSNADDQDDTSERQRSFFSGKQDNSAKEKRRTELLEQAVRDAKDAEVVVIMSGVPEIHESEGFDRENLDLPTHHNQLIHRICEVNQNVVVVLSNGGPVAMPWKDKVKGIVECYLLGQAGARAVLDILFGIVSPSGKLTETFPLKMADVPSDKNFPGDCHTVEYREGLHVGYRYYDSANVPVLFPFGHGLSYTSFTYTNCSCKAINDDEGSAPVVEVHCTVTNNGTCSGSEVVQIYVHHKQSIIYHPEQQLKEFQKTSVLQPGQTEDLTFVLTEEAFAYYDTGLSAWNLEEGATYEIRVAASSRDIRWRDSIRFVTQEGTRTTKATTPSEEARLQYPFLNVSKDNDLSCPLTVNDEAFHAMLGFDRHELMHLSSRTLLGHFAREDEPLLSNRNVTELANTGVLPHEIDFIHRNSFLCEIESSGCVGKLFVGIIIKVMEGEMENQNDARERKLLREVARNLPMRCLATFSRGKMSFDILDSLLAFFNGHYYTSASYLASSASNTVSGVVNMRR